MTVSTLVGQFLFLSSLCVLGLSIAKLTKIDMTLASLAAGIIGALLIPILGIDTGIRASNIHDLVFYIILPVLVFDAAWHIKPALLKQWLSPIFLMATVGVLAGCFIVATITFFGIGHSAGFPWIAALLTGAILSATDPVAVVAILKKLGAPEDLATLVEGESLFNDATAVVLFTVVLGFATASTQANDNYATLFLSVFFGGMIVGGLCAFLAAKLALLLGNQPSGNIILILLAFASFYIAEHLLHVSGIMAVMSAAIVSKLLLQNHHEQILKDMHSTWEWLGLYFNAFIFVLMGLTIVFSMFTEQWLAMVIAIVAAIIARAVVVFTLSASTRLTARPIPFDWQLVMFWGGLKGAIAIALVLSLPVELPYWWTIQSMVFGVVLFSLLIQGTTTGFFVRRITPSEKK